MVLYFECRINKHALPETVFLAILPTINHLYLQIKSFILAAKE